MRWAWFLLLLPGCNMEPNCLAEAVTVDSWSHLQCGNGEVELKNIEGKLLKICHCQPRPGAQPDAGPVVS